MLADLAWGAIWRMISANRSSSHETAGGSVLPYTRADAPAGRAIHWMRELASVEGGSSGWQELVAAAFLVVALSLLLGGTASVISLLAVCIMIAGAVFRERWGEPLVAHAFISVALPWTLGLSLAAHSGEAWMGNDQAPAVAVAVSFTALAWGVLRARLPGSGGARAIFFGHGCVLASVIWLRAPAAVAVLAVLLLSPSLWVLRDKEGAPAIAAGGPWWLVAMMLGALAARGSGHQ